MVVHGQVEQSSRLNELSSNGPILRRRRGVAARVIMYNNNTGSSLGDGSPEHFPGVNQGAIEQAASDEDVPQDLALAVQGK